ncbi:MAG: multiubiquitin domain-containing protein [Dehalococcoidia bacterium]
MPPEKEVTLVVNTKPHSWTHREISYAQVVQLAYPAADFSDERITYTVKYRRGMGNKPQGSLVAGTSVKVKDRMTFDVTKTDRS